MIRHGSRPHIEAALTLDVGRMQALDVLRDGARGTWQWSRDGKAFATIGYSVSLHGDHGTLTLVYSHTDRRGKREDVTSEVSLSSVALHFGGRRWYAHCPFMGMRARKLYKFAYVDQFCHRNAIRPRPTYASQRDSGCDRIIRQRWALRRKLGDKFSDLYGEPMKPKWMRKRTFDRYAKRDAELANLEDAYLARLLARVERAARG